jgi:hypothetical protein
MGYSSSFPLFPWCKNNGRGILPACSKLDSEGKNSIISKPFGGRSSMVESKIVELVVAGSNPVGHPILFFHIFHRFFRP